MSEFKRMVAGELYKASKVEPEYKPDNNRALNQEINQLYLIQKKLWHLKKNFLVKLVMSYL